MSMLTRRTTLAGLSALPLVAGATRAMAKTNGASPSDKSISHLMDMTSVPGLQIAALRGGRLAASRSFGKLRADRDEAVRDHSLFEAASLTKPVFAVTVHELVKRGRIDLDRPLHLDVPVGDDAKAQHVTARHVLSHSTGFPNWRDKPGDLVSKFDPGSKFGYSGEGFFLLQRVVERVTGRTAASWMRELVLDPAGMTRASFGPPTESGIAWQHNSRGVTDTEDGPPQLARRLQAGPKRNPESWTYDEQIAAATQLGNQPLPMFLTPNVAAGLWITASDYARFLAFARRYDALRHPVVPVKGALAWSLGWGLEQAEDAQFAWHWGDNGGVKDYFALDLARGDGLVVLTNGQSGAKVYQSLIRAWFGRDFDALLWV